MKSNLKWWLFTPNRTIHKTFLGFESIDDQNCHRLDLQQPSKKFQVNAEGGAKSKWIPSGVKEASA
jgi:hypothetical protein